MDSTRTTSTVDWCEDNYAYTTYIAEFWNTLSSLVLTYAGCVGFAAHRNFTGSTVFLWLAIVGAGSVCFHGFLTAETQMLDEIPMIFMVVQLAINIFRVTGVPKRIFAYIIGTIFACIIMKTAFLQDGKSLELDKTSGPRKVEFYIFQSAIVLTGVGIFKQLVKNSMKQRNTRKLFKKGCGIFLIGWGCWLTDYFMCSTLQQSWNPQLHAWWHVFSAIGVYNLSLLSLLFANPQLHFSWGELGSKIPVVFGRFVIEKRL